MTQQLPVFFILGAQKAGTTSLHDRLKYHPDVCLPKLKETQFFAFEEKFSLGFDWYRQQFHSCREGQLMGEICPDYMYFPETAKRIRSVIECPKMIFIFRHPLYRAHSHYLMSVRQGFEELSFGEALEAEKERIANNQKSVIYHSYMSRGAYAEQVQRFQSVFPSAEFMYIRFEDLTDNGSVGEKVFSDICDFLGIVRISIDEEIHSNAASLPRSKWLRDFLYGQSLVKTKLGLLLPRHIKEKITVIADRWNQVKIHNEGIGDISPMIIEQARLEVDKLQLLTGLDLSSWTKADVRDVDGLI